jgi:hypothetical protein
MRFAAIVALLGMVAATSGAASAAKERDPSVYTLYRNSILFPDLRIHVATFDAQEGTEYNRTNCELARGLFQQQPGVSVQYWCEPGRFEE